MFQLICLTTGEPVNGELYASAEEALNAKHSLGVKARIQRVITNEWAVREYARLNDGTYEPVPEFLQPYVITNHYVHVSSTDRTRIAYTQSPEKGMEDRQTVTTVSAYLGKYAADKLQPHEIRDIADRYAAWAIGETVVVISHTREAFRFAYSGQRVYSPSSMHESCMARTARSYTGKDNLHPAEAYSTDSNGLHIAYTVKHDDPNVVTARAVVWPHYSTYNRVYAIDDAYRTALREYLEANEYKYSTGYEGAPLSRIDAEDGNLSDCDEGEFLMPYIDGEYKHVEDRPDRKRFFICDSGSGDYLADSTSGTLMVGSSCLRKCTNCGDRLYDSDSIYEVDGDIWCESCTDDGAMFCEHYEEYYSTQTTNFVTVICQRGSTRFEALWCESAARNDAFRCERTDNYYRDDHFTEVEVHIDRNGTTETWCLEDAERDGEVYYCEHCERYFANTQDLVAHHAQRCQDCLDELIKAEDEAGRLYPVYIPDARQIEMGV